MSKEPIKVARGLLLHGQRSSFDGDLSRQEFLTRIGVNNNTFRTAAGTIGAHEKSPGGRFFQSGAGGLEFGPGAGLMLSVSVGTESLRAALIDANGRMWHREALPSMPGQLDGGPDQVLDRIKEIGARVLTAALNGEPDPHAAPSDPRRSDLLVRPSEGTAFLPLLGVAVAWPIPLSREKQVYGRLGEDPKRRWRGSLSDRVARALSIDESRSHALNDADAAALCFAFDQSSRRENLEQKYPELTLVLRVAGGIGGATIIVEPPKRNESYGTTSGFTSSTLLGGRHTLAGEIGHLEVPQQFVEHLNAGNTVEGLAGLAPVACSCVHGPETSLHLEALASTAAVANRVDSSRPASEVLKEVIENDDDPRHAHALKDAGTLLGWSLRGPVAWLNPARIVLTGALAVPPVEAAFKDALLHKHPITTDPAVDLIADRGLNDFTRVRGAGLAVIREKVHREFAHVLGANKKTVASRVAALTLAVDQVPWP